MNITLKMNIQDQDFELVCNLTNHAGRIYRQQFNRDILKDMNEVYRQLHKSPFEGIDLVDIDVNGKTEQEIYEQILSKVDVSKLIELQTNQTAMSFEDTETCGHIIWAFVKNADKNTPTYEQWIDDFDFVLPVGEIVSALHEAWTKSAVPTVELKN